MRAPRNNGRKTGRLALIIAILAVIGGGLLFVRSWEQKQLRQEADRILADEESPERMTIYYNGAWYVLRDDLDTFLILGLDKYENTRSDPDSYINNQQSDFLLLMVVDDSARSYSAIQINRDTMAEIQRLGVNGEKIDTIYAQLALAHTYGSGGKDSCRNTVQAVSRYLYDVPIDHYFSMTMDAIPILNDLVGGVTVRIEDDLTSLDPSMEPGSVVQLKGDMALQFVRARMAVSDGSNLSRMNRQRVYMSALYEQLAKKLKQSDSFGRQMAVKLSDYVVSDLMTTELADFANQCRDYYFAGITGIRGEAVKGREFMEFYTEESDLQRLVVETFFEPEKENRK